jgi:ABC-type branched-subunit amino acid transport system substrate-binding protein
MLKEHPMVALVGPYHYEQTKAVSLITSALGIPNITPTASGQFIAEP